MASKVKKGFLYYIAWALFIVFGIACIFACILIFNPGKDIFGINLCYISDSRVIEYQKVNDKWFADTNITAIDFESTYTKFSVVRNSDYSIMTLKLNKKIVGFGNDEKNCTYNISMNLVGSTLQIKIEEPNLTLPLAPNASMTLFCPKELNLNNISFNIKTTSGGVSFGENGKDAISMDVKDIDVSTDSGSVTLTKNVNLQSGVLDIKSKTANISINNNISNNLNIETQSSKVVVPKIGGNLNITAKELKVTSTEILGNVKFSSEKGYIKIAKLGNISALTNGNFTAEVDKMHIANIIIGEMAGDLTLPSAGASDITVDKLHGEALIVTTSGNVNLKNCNSQVSVETQSGNVTLTQNSTTEATNIETKKGKITTTFNYLYQSNLESESGNIVINVKDGLQFKLDYFAKKGLSVSWITTDIENEGTFLAPNTSNSTNKVINATTNGKINVYNFQ